MKHELIKHWQLYVITDEFLSRGRSHLQIAKETISGGANVIQLRDKFADTKELYKIGCQIRKLAHQQGVSFIVNDRLDIALATDADGLHIGQNDLPAKIARKWLGHNKILGVSATTLEEAVIAEEEGADYLGVGPIYEARSTKSDAGEPLGLSLLRQIRIKCKKPLVAIGGIQIENLEEVFHAGADAVAVISAIVTSENIRLATEVIKKRIFKVFNK